VGINGLYRGIVFESLLLIENIGADLWVVQGGRAGPFAESSTVPDGIVRRLEGVAGVREARRFVYFSKQFDILGRRMSIGIFPETTDNGFR
jgi:putative ABC transport system permease protein